jgi:hypothetical protein
MVRGSDVGSRTLVRRAQGGDVKAFVELTRRYQHLAFGLALAWIHDLQRAEDVIQMPFPFIGRPVTPSVQSATQEPTIVLPERKRTVFLSGSAFDARDELE